MFQGDPCLSPEQLTRAAFDVGASRFLGHASRCPQCADELQEISYLRQIALQLPDGAPTEDAADTVLARILEADLTARLPKRNTDQMPVRRGLIAAGVLFFFGIIYTMLHVLVHLHTPNIQTVQTVSATQTHQEVFRASVHPNPDARFSIADGQPDEIVRLIDGSIAVHVDKLKPGERFRVITGNAEIEVRGTTFDVRAVDNELISVRVINGLVEVRPQHQKAVVLRPGEEWTCNEGANVFLSKETGRNHSGAGNRHVSTLRSTPIQSSLSAADKSVQKPTLRQRDPASRVAETAFNEGWAAYNAGQLREAVRRFDAAYDADARSGFAEDAMFWKAVALDRSQNEQAAIKALYFFIDTYPHSRRTLEACAMLGWKRLDSGDTEGARRLFVRAQKSKSTRVHNSAVQGLERLQMP